MSGEALVGTIIALAILLVVSDRGSKFLGLKNPVFPVLRLFAKIVFWPIKMLCRPLVDELKIRYDEYLKDRRRTIRRNRRARRGGPP